MRDSKLTRIFDRLEQDPAVSPSIASMNETSSTLQFADRVKRAVFEKPAHHSIEKKRTVDI